MRRKAGVKALGVMGGNCTHIPAHQGGHGAGLSLKGPGYGRKMLLPRDKVRRSSLRVSGLVRHGAGEAVVPSDMRSPIPRADKEQAQAGEPREAGTYGAFLFARFKKQRSKRGVQGGFSRL